MFVLLFLLIVGFGWMVWDAATSEKRKEFKKIYAQTTPAIQFIKGVQVTGCFSSIELDLNGDNINVMLSYIPEYRFHPRTILTSVRRNGELVGKWQKDPQLKACVDWTAERRFKLGGEFGQPRRELLLQGE